MSTMSVRPWRRVGFTAVALALVVSSAVGEEPQQAAPYVPEAGTGRVEGKIRAADGKTPIRGAVVLAYHLSNEKLYRSEPSDKAGQYRISGLPHGYVDLWVETEEGIFAASQVVNVSPGRKTAVSFSLIRYEDRPPGSWGETRKLEVPGTVAVAVGMAEIGEDPLSYNFWKTPAGIAVASGAAGLSLLVIAASGDDERTVSPFEPLP